MVVDHAADIGVVEDLKMRLRSLDVRINDLQGVLDGLGSKSDGISTKKRVVLESTLSSLRTERTRIEEKYVEVGGVVVPIEAPKVVEPELTLKEKFEAEADDRQDHDMMRKAIKMKMESSQAAKDLMDAIRIGDFDQPLKP